MKYTVSSPETEQRLATVEPMNGDWELALVDEKGSEQKLKLSGIRVLVRDGMLEVALEGGVREVFPLYRRDADGVVTIATALGNIRLLPTRGAVSDAAGAGKSGSRSLKSSMPGKVLKLLCKPGDFVEPGQPLLIIEAMKMENEIRSPQAGLVEEFGVQPGQSIQTGEVLVKIGSGEKK